VIALAALGLGTGVRWLGMRTEISGGKTAMSNVFALQDLVFHNFFQMDLATRFDAAFDGAPSPPARETPLPRIPPKQAPPVARSKVNAARHRSPVRSMKSMHLRDVTNKVDLGVVLASKSISKRKVRITTTLTTVDVYDDRVVRGRLGKKGLYGATVEHVNPFC
jgi:hypothetical protein